MLSRLALGAIYVYQQVLSPRKGFRCAHAVLHGGTGCSGFAKYAIRDHGVWRALPLIRQRFSACRAAYEALHTPRAAGPWGKQTDPDKKRQSKCDVCNCAGGIECGACLPRAYKTGSDCTPNCDAGCDCGGCAPCS